jgi:lipopolysaccharide export system permease protein
MYKLLEKYIFKTFSSSFFPIFFTLYTITSIIFLVKIATLTSVIQMNFIELIQLYGYYIPIVLFYTLPVSYFVGVIITISKLSSDYETIVITSFGLNPTRLLQLLLTTTFVISLLLFIVSLGLIPKAKYLKENFLNIKKQEAQFNIKASEYGQQIGSWFIYVNKEHQNTFQDITLLQLEENKDMLISADFATIESKNGSLSINLEDGKSFSISDSIQQVDFEKMILRHTTPKAQNIKSLNDIIIYWSDRKKSLKKSKDFTFNILVSLFPLISVFFYIAIGYFNPRYDNNRAAAIGSVFVVLFIIISNQSAKLYPNTALLIVPFVWFFAGYLYYWFTTRRLY